ncbi:S8 family peptidase [Streptomyces sp. NBC_00096]|uniref:S8 family peptidase n=1 Tax=Streptomyces sp. NBC_00096 TaxID=2975650 RepID=UPI00325332E0
MRTAALAVAAVGTLIAGATSAGIQPARAASSAAKGTKPSAASTVTLITGDRVVVGSDGGVRQVVRGKGREGTVFSVRREAGHTYVIPQDALGLIGDGVLDRRLFDVAQLVEYKYDDAHRSALPLIVGYGSAGGGSGAGASLLKSAGDPLAGVARDDRRPLPAVDGEAFAAPKDGVAALWSAVTGAAGNARTAGAAPAAAITHLWLDGKVRTTLDTSVPQIGAPTMWAAGYTGKGVKVAVLDTGIDETHPDLKGIEAAQKNFTESDSLDHIGHGTHVASTIAGTGAQSGGRYKGVAPGVQLLDGKVIADDGYGTESSIVSGMQWAVDQGAKVVNMSLGGQDGPGLDPKEEAIARLSDRALFVVAAGNRGNKPGTITSPGSAPEALTVGAVDKQDRLADFSSRGPTVDGVSKPDVTAPGVDITAAQSTQSWDPPGNGYISMSGTSMATPHVAGSAALLLQQHPGWSGAQLKALLTGSAKPDPVLNANQQGAGRVDLTRAVTASVVSEPGSLDFGTQAWPHTDDKPVAKTLTYRNYGTQAVKLRLSQTGTDPAGGPAPAGMFTLKDTELTVPAGGSASTTVTVDSSRGTLDGGFGGTVLAAGDGQSVRTGIVVVREVESYDVVLRHIDVNGAVPPGYSSAVTRIGRDEPGRIDFPGDPSGTSTLRLPVGEYQLESVVFNPDGRMAVFVQPVVKVSAKTAIVLDSRKAKPFAVTAPDPAARLVNAIVGYSDETAQVASAWVTDGQTPILTQALGSAGPRIKAQYTGVWKRPGAAGRNVDYRLAFNRTGSWFTGLKHTVTRAEVAEVKLSFGASVTGTQGLVYATPFDETGQFAIGGREPIQQGLPLASTQYVSAVGVRWSWEAAQLNAQGDYRANYLTDLTSYKPGSSNALDFNTGVVGPGMDAKDDQGAVTRYGDRIDANVELFRDGSGHRGGSAVSGGFTRLESGGELIAEGSESGWVGADVPAASAAYRLSAESTRAPEDTATSTKVAAVWTFTSARPASDEQVTLPLSTVRLSPELSLSGTARAGCALKVPLYVGGAAAAPGQVAALAVKVSYDGGRTWQPVTVSTDAKGARSVTVKHPATARAVSFQVDLRDKAGNTVRETITDAYRLVP